MYWRWETKLTNEAHLSSNRSCRTWLSERERVRERSMAGAGRTFDMPWMTGRQRVAWRATYAKMVNLMLKLFLFGKFVIVILKWTSDDYYI